MILLDMEENLVGNAVITVRIVYQKTTQSPLLAPPSLSLSLFHFFYPPNRRGVIN